MEQLTGDQLSRREAARRVREAYELEKERLQETQKAQQRKEEKVHGDAVARNIRKEQKALKEKRRALAEHGKGLVDGLKRMKERHTKGSLFGLVKSSPRQAARERQVLQKNAKGTRINIESRFDQKIAAIQNGRTALRAEYEEWAARRDRMFARESSALQEKQEGRFAAKVAQAEREIDEQRLFQLMSLAERDGSLGGDHLEEHDRLMTKLAPEGLTTKEALRQEFRENGRGVDDGRRREGGYAY